MKHISLLCVSLCIPIAASTFGAETGGCMPRNQQDTLTLLANRISALQQRANGGRYGANKDEVRLQFASDNFSTAENGAFRYRAIFTKQGEEPAITDKTIGFTSVTSIYPMPVSADGIGALMIRYGRGDTVSLFYRNSGAVDGKLLGAILDFMYHVNKAHGRNMDKLYTDWRELVQRAGTYESVSLFIANYPNSFLTDFARMIRDNKQQQKD